MTMPETPIFPASRTTPPQAWVVVLPVKLLRDAKTRLEPLAQPARAELALAMAVDTVAAALGCDLVSSVLAVTNDNDDEALRALAAAGAVVVPDVPDRGLNAAFAHGAALARERHPEAGVVALTADVPALKAAELVVLLRAASTRPRTVVADTTGEGTVALTAWPATDLDPHFGERSFARHIDSGAVAVDVDTPGLRRDVDTVDDLRVAMRLGCGPQTTAVARRVLGVTSRQATVRDYDTTGGGGTALCDDGTPLAFGREAVDRGGLRLLRPGQRVRLTLVSAADGADGAGPGVSVVTLVTLDPPDG